MSDNKSRTMHPLHPAVVHFPLAFLLAAPVFQGWYFFSANLLAWQAAVLMLKAGLVMSLPAAASGALDFFQRVMQEKKTAAYNTAFLHIMVMLTAIMVDAGELVYLLSLKEISEINMAFAMAPTALAGLLLLSGGWLGGHLVYGHNIGRAP